ncbi:MAG: hypothetical protein GY715_15770 [Planctomycetes bacterium]|nr:hypothetical protein [Planctomycetota bacterium]
MKTLRLILLPAALLVGGCTSTYLHQFAYVPMPAKLELTARADEMPLVRILVSVIGVRRADRDAGLPVTVEMRVRVENLGTDETLTFDPTSLTLLSGDLETFSPPVLSTDAPMTVPAHGASTVEALFPVPGDGTTSAVDMDGLNLQWTIRLRDRAIPGSVTLTRRPHPTYVYRPIEPGPWRRTHYWRYCR